jgi:rSAM/selenodomain-associated transferase 2/rSAM/selenodomain-associated transferase 1
VLGADRAAAVHAKLARITTDAALRYQCQSGAAVEVHSAGGSSEAMRQLLGDEVLYRTQRGAGLGERLSHAVGDAFRRGAKKVIVIGTDCPDLDAYLLNDAAQALDRHDVVLGPALDGGYYLIGCRAHDRRLFEGIDWGTSGVLAQTLIAAQRSGRDVHQLKALSDVDHAEDLIACRRRENDFEGLLPTVERGMLSVIIPARNEASRLAATLDELRKTPNLERIVVDGGSTDDTIAIAQQHGATVVSAPRGRGSQLNAGAAMSRGEVLLFLHADTRLPATFATEIWSLLTDDVAFGAFRLAIDRSTLSLRVIQAGANWRSRWRGIAYGDQAMFIRSARFFQAGGFRNWPLMEDYEFSRRMRRQGKVAISSQAVSTSSRRWTNKGAVRTTFLNQCFVAAFRMGVSPERLSQWYYGTK